MATTSAPTTTTEAHLFGLPLSGGVPLMLLFLGVVVVMIIIAMVMCFRLGKARSKMKYQKFDNKNLDEAEGETSANPRPVTAGTVKLSRGGSLNTQRKPMFNTARMERFLSKMRRDEEMGIVPTFSQSRKEKFGRPTETPMPLHESDNQNLDLTPDVRGYASLLTGNAAPVEHRLRFSSSSSVGSTQDSIQPASSFKSVKSQGSDVSKDSHATKASSLDQTVSSPETGSTVFVGLNSRVLQGNLAGSQIKEIKKIFKKNRKRGREQVSPIQKPVVPKVKAEDGSSMTLGSGRSLSLSSDA